MFDLGVSVINFEGRTSAPEFHSGPEYFLYGLVLRKEIGAAS